MVRERTGFVVAATQPQCHCSRTAAGNLRHIKAIAAGGGQSCIMSQFIFRCPSRGLMVQGWNGNSEDGKYVAYRCPACGGLHLVNPTTGKLLADERAEKKGDDGKSSS